MLTNSHRGFLTLSRIVMDRIKGTVKTFNPRFGYGFIATPEGTSIFVHQTNIKSEGYRVLKPGMAVEFEVKEKNGRPSAYEVTNEDGSSIVYTPKRPRKEVQQPATKE